MSKMRKIDAMLFQAVHDGDTGRFSVLCDRGADANAVNEQGLTPLMVAVDDSFTLTELLDKFDGDNFEGEDAERAVSIDSSDDHYRTALMHAAALPDDGGADSVDVLIKWAASVDEEDLQGMTALHHAARAGNTDAALTLLRGGADDTIRDKAGLTPLETAEAHGRSGTVAAIVNEHLLPEAVKKNDLDAVRGLVARGANINTTDRRDGRTVAHHIQSPEMVTLLHEVGADWSAKSKNKKSVLHTILGAAPGDAQVAIVQELARVGAPLDEGDELGATPLMFAFNDKRHKDPATGEEVYGAVGGLVEALVKAGVAVNRSDEWGTTAMMNAVSQRDDDKVRGAVSVLIEAGADLGARNSHGETAWQVAGSRAHLIDEVIAIRERANLLRTAQEHAIAGPIAHEPPNQVRRQRL